MNEKEKILLKLEILRGLCILGMIAGAILNILISTSFMVLIAFSFYYIGYITNEINWLNRTGKNR